MAISDTHGKHRKLTIPTCDILIHAGDACQDGNQEQLDDFFLWFANQPARHKIFISGNHDLPFALDPDHAKKYVPREVIFMNNSILEIENVVIVSVEAHLGLLCDVDIEDEQHIDIFISHCAPKDILDENGKGCEKLRSLIFQTQPTISIFGHFHNSGGKEHIENGIRFINVSMATNTTTE